MQINNMATATSALPGSKAAGVILLNGIINRFVTDHAITAMSRLFKRILFLSRFNLGYSKKKAAVQENAIIK